MGREKIIKTSIWLCLILCTNSLKAQNYNDYYASWDWSEFMHYSPGGGGSVTAQIEQDVLSVKFSAGFAPSTTKVGPVKQLNTSPQLPDMVLGMLDQGQVQVSIQNGWLTLTAIGSNYISGFNTTFKESLVTKQLDLTHWILSPSGGEYFIKGQSFAAQVDLNVHNPGAVTFELYDDNQRISVGAGGGSVTYNSSTLAYGSKYRVKAIDASTPSNAIWSGYFTIGPDLPNVTGGGETCDPNQTFSLTAQTPITCGQTATHRWYTSETGNTYQTGTDAYPYCGLSYSQISSNQTSSYWVASLIYDAQGQLLVESARTPVSVIYNIEVPNLTAKNIYQNTQCGPVAEFLLVASGGQIGSTYAWYDQNNVLLGEGTPFQLQIGQENFPADGKVDVYLTGILKNSFNCDFVFNYGDVEPLHLVVIEFDNINAGPDKTFFADDPPVALSATPDGGTWDQNAYTIRSTFFPANAAIGSNRLSYRITTQSCSANDIAFYNVLAVPNIDFVSAKFLERNGNHQITLTTTNGQTYQSYQWYRNGKAINGANNQTLSTSQTGNYQLEVMHTGRVRKSNTLKVRTSLAQQDLNYIVSYTPLIEGYLDGGTLEYAPVTDVNEQVTYFDDLGRQTQSVLTQGSHKFMDIVSPSLYDPLGREAKKYLAYVSPSQNGTFKSNAIRSENYQLSEQFQFYNNGQFDVPQSKVPYAEVRYDESPLERVLEQGAPGQDWQLGMATTRFYHTFNTYEEKVLQFNPNSTGTLTASGYFNTGQLSKTITIDQNGFQRIKYTDKEGKQILVRAEVDQQTKEWAETYSAYDLHGNLTFVLPPEISTTLIKTSFPLKIKTIDLDRWVFQYRYDDEHRMIEKKIPGADWQWMIYDNRNRLVLSQDGNQRLNYEWLFVKYDFLNRAISTGIFETTAERGKLQAVIDNYYSKTSTLWFEKRGNDTHGYTNLTYPQVSDETKYLTVTYYDDYNFPNVKLFSFIPELGNVEYMSSPKGYITGTKTKILDGTNRWLSGISYYDHKHRLIQGQTETHLNGIDRVTTKYDFNGQELASLTTHDNKKISISSEYDHGRRLVNEWHEIFEEGVSQGKVLLIQNKYNDLGQVVDKNIHSQDQGINFAQSVDYRYNIRGWVKSINNSELKQDPYSNDDDDDFWGMELTYNETFETNIASTRFFDGNISAIKWSVNQGLGDIKQRAYTYRYDGLNRLLEAKHAIHSKVWRNTGEFSLDHIKYDLNGNIKELDRNDMLGENMDNLTYTYMGNKLISISDEGNPEDGFIDSNIQNDDYTYDPNGNMIADRNKDISRISYNYMNLPTKVENSTGAYLSYIYDAEGVKLTKSLHNADGSIQEKTDYLGEFNYLNNNLQLIHHDEGRILPPNSSGSENVYEYQYNLKDYLGTNRITFTTVPKTTEYLATMESGSPEIADFEESIFNNIPETRHTFRGASSSPDEVAMLNREQPVGPAISLSVSTGDVINMQVHGYFEGGTGNGNSINPNTMTAAIASAFGGSQGAPGEAGQVYDMFSTALGILGFGGAVNDNMPAGYLNYLLFDSNMTYQDGGYINISSASSVFSLGPIQVKVPGYLFVYLTNESETLNPVYFDDLKITHYQSPVLHMDDYYPGGATFNSYSQPFTKDQNFKYQTKEWETELGLNLYDFEARMYDPYTWRTTTLDPHAENYYDMSPYSWTGNNPILNIDPNGKDFGVYFENGKIIIRAAFVSNSEDAEDLEKAMTYWKELSGHFVYVVGKGEQAKAIPINFEFEPEIVNGNGQSKPENGDHTAASLMVEEKRTSNEENEYNSYAIVDKHRGFNDGDERGLTGGTHIFIREGASYRVDASKHEMGHNLGMPHGTGLMKKTGGSRVSTRSMAQALSRVGLGSVGYNGNEGAGAYATLHGNPISKSGVVMTRRTFEKRRAKAQKKALKSGK